MNVKRCVHVLHNVYRACCDVLFSTFDPRIFRIFNETQKKNKVTHYVSIILLGFYLNMAFLETKNM